MLGRFEVLLVILVIILVLFGDNKLPALSRSIAKILRGRRKGAGAGGNKDEAGKSKK